jgi:hypothetical protein
MLDVGLGDGAMLLSTHPGRTGERIGPRVRLEPWETIVMSRQAEV